MSEQNISTIASRPVISIVMLVKNELPSLSESIPLISKQITNYPYEIIIIDSGSSDGSVEYIKEQSEVDSRIILHEIKPEEFHHAKTRNLGVDLSQGKFIVFLGGDAVPYNKEWLFNLVEYPVEFESDDIVASYGKQIPKENTDISNYCRMTYNYHNEFIVKNNKSNLSSKNLYFFSSVNCCINLSKLTLPLFDETIPVNEDITLSKKIINSNYQIVYCPKAAVIHSHNYTYWEILQRFFDNAVIYRKLNVFTKNDPSVNKDGSEFLKYSLNILKHRKLKDGVDFFLFFFFAAIGIKLGQNYKLLPKKVSKRLTKYGTV